MNNGVPRTPWELWALALLGLGLWIERQHWARPAAAATPPAPTAPAVGINWGGLAADLGLIVAAVALCVLLGLLAARLVFRWRRARAYRLDEIILGPDDTATPYEIMSALDAIHGQLLTRYGRSAMGQVSWSFEMVRDADGMIHFLLGAPFDWLTAIEDVWRSKYTNIRFAPWSETPRAWPIAQQIVLTKHWRHATETVKDYQNSVVETLVQALDRAQGGVHLQYLLTPLPAEALHAALRSQIRAMEYQARQQQVSDPAAPGVGYADSQAVKDALQLYGKAAFRTEIRLAADAWDSVQRVFGALGEANGENRFRATTVVVGKGWWLRWFAARLPSLALFGSQIMFSFPLATLIHLPSARLRVNSLRRSLVRRGPAPRAVPRDPRLAILRDEVGLVGIPEGDRKYNTLLVGSQGSGKTTVLQSLIRVDSRWTDAAGLPKCLVVLDIGKDTAKRALGIVPADREVIWFDPADPACPWSLNPMLTAVNDAVLADNVLEGLTEVFGDEAIRARSREFLGNAILAIRDVMGDQADFTHVYQLLTEETFRNRVIAAVRDPHQQRYWQHVFTQAMANNPRFLEEGLAAPRNKLDEVLRNPLIRAALETGTGRQLIDCRAVIAGRKVLIANLDKSKLGEAGARLVGILLITMLWHAMQAQTDLPEAERVPVSLIIDEAQNFIAPGFLDILAEGRAYGAQITVAVRFLGEIASEKVVKGLQALAQNLIVHQFELLEEAEVFMKRFMRVFANMITTADESQDALNFGADDFMRLPKYHAVCRFMVQGSPQQAFLAQTIPWEAYYQDAVADAHRAAQPRVTRPARPGPALPPDAPSAAPAPPGARTAPAAPRPPAEAPAADRASDTGVAAPPPSLDVLSLLLGPEAAQQLLTTACDGVTGLYTRAVWDRAVAQATGTGHAVAFCDLDDLKAVNDREGHAAGDAYLKRAAAALRSVARTGDLVARYGGDELVLLAPGLPPETLTRWTQRIRDALQTAGVSASLGVAHQADDEDLAACVKRADAAMYAEKTARRAASAPAVAAVPPPARGDDSAPVQDPERWHATDPRRVFCERNGLQPAAVVGMARRLRATDRDLREACYWLVAHGVGGPAAMARLKRLLELKVEDRLLQPVATQCRADLRSLRETLVKLEVDPATAVAWAAAHPEVTSLAALAAGLGAAAAEA